MALANVLATQGKHVRGDGPLRSGRTGYGPIRRSAQCGLGMAFRPTEGSSTKRPIAFAARSDRSALALRSFRPGHAAVRSKTATSRRSVVSRMPCGTIPRWSKRISACRPSFDSWCVPDEAVAASRRALQSLPIRRRRSAQWALALQLQGESIAAIAAFRRAWSWTQSDAFGHSNLLYTLNFQPACDPAALFAEHLPGPDAMPNR